MNEIIIEHLKQINSKLDKHGDKLEMLLVMHFKCEKLYLRKPTWKGVSIALVTLGTVSAAIASLIKL